MHESSRRSDSMNYCPYCGTEINPNWDYCPNCSYYLTGDRENLIDSSSFYVSGKRNELDRMVEKKTEFISSTYPSRNEREKATKYKVIITILSLALIISGMGNFILINQFYIGPGPSPPNTLIVGTNSELFSLDPINAWDSGSYDVVSQVVETLFWYDLSDPSLNLEPLLVDDYEWGANNTVLSLNLKNYIIFHDLYPFNASAVKWNIERWLYLTNSTGLIVDSSMLAYPSSLFYFLDGSPIFSHCDVVDEFTVNITLNKPFGPFLSLLTAPFCSIISPHSHSQSQYIDLYEGDLIGTGPFLFERYVPSIQVDFTRWTGYWRMPAYYEKVILEFFGDQESLTQALITGGVDIDLNFPQGVYPIEEYQGIKFVKSGTDLAYYYMGFNNQKINRTVREALSFAFNYTHAIKVIKSGNAERGCPAVPQSMPGHNASVQSNLPQMNISRARILMQEMGYGLGWDVSYPGLDESSWKSAHFASDLLGTPLKLNLIMIYSINEQLNELATQWWQLIGINTAIEEFDWSDYLFYINNDPDHFHVWFSGWAPDYPEPYNMLDPLFAPGSPFNIGQVNILLVNELLHNASLEMDLTSRLNIYQRIQYILFEREFVHMPLWANYQYTVHAAHLKSVPYNSLDRLYVYPIYEFQ